MAWVLITPKRNAHLAKKCLEERNLFDKTRKITEFTGKEVIIPIKQEAVEQLKCEKHNKDTVLPLEGRVKCLDIPCQRKHRMSPREKLKSAVYNMLLERGITPEGVLLEDTPSHWERHGDLIILPEKSFTSDQWKIFGDELWQLVGKSLGASRLAKKSTVSNDNFRTPQINLLLGDSGWVKHIDNGITYTFDVIKCMFSSGNITEKIRIGGFNCEGQTVVDLYAGIGYFVLPYLVHAKASIVHACEWNTHAVKALKKNLELNGVDDRCIIHEGDNQNFPLQGVADHVNLGLIPSSEPGWPVACAALRHDRGGWLHVHGNVSSGLGFSRSREWQRKDVETLFKQEDMSTSPALMRTMERINSEIADTDGMNNGQELTCSLQRKNSLDLLENNYIKEKDSDNVHFGLVFEQASKMTNTDQKLNVHSSEGDTIGTVSRTCNDCQTSVREIFIQDCDGYRHSIPTENCLPTCNRILKREWLDWAKYVSHTLVRLLKKLYSNKDWEVQIRHIEHVKSYAPHIDHIVLDVECRPVSYSL